MRTKTNIVNYTKIRGKEYVYIRAERHTLPDGTMSQDHKTYLGTMVDGVFVSNSNYKALPVSQKRLLGLESNPKENEVEKAIKKEQAKAELEVSTVMKTRKFYGNYHLLMEAADKCGLLPLLKKSFPQDFKEILSICFFLILDKNNALYRFNAWGRLHEHPYNKTISSAASSQFLDTLSESSINKFLTDWAQTVGDNSIIAVDSTSISTYAKKNPQARRGINKDHDIINQINLLVGFGAISHLPVYMKPLSGNISDVSTITNFIADFKNYGIFNATFFLDRGFYSKSNIISLLENNYKFLCAVKGKPLFVKNCFKDLNVLSHEYYLKEYQVYATTVRYQLPYRINGKQKSKRVYLTKSYDPTIKYHEEMKLDEEITILYEELLTNNIQHKKKEYEKYFTISWKKEKREIVKNSSIASLVEQPKIVEIDTPDSFEYNEKAIDEKRKSLGWVCFISDVYLEPISVVANYRKRDTVEKFFENLKERIGMRRLRTGKKNVVDAKLFIGYVALIIYEEIEKRKKQAELKNSKSWFCGKSMQEVFNEFEPIEQYFVGKGQPRYSEIISRHHTLLSELQFKDLFN